MPPPKHDSEESDWNENLYLHQYQAKVQSQVPIRQPPPGWSTGEKNSPQHQRTNQLIRVIM